MTEPDTCLFCATVKGVFQPPGGIVYETAQWMVVLRANPVRFPCMPLILLKRHIEDMSCLAPEESSSMGRILQSTAKALKMTVQPAKVHFGIYSESVKHIHVHVFPRMPDMPAGNLPNLWIGQWLELLHALKLRKAFSSAEVAGYAEPLRQAYRTLENSTAHG